MKIIGMRQDREKVSQRLWANQIFKPRLVPYYVFVLIFVLSSSSVLAAAQVSLPGNPLYGIKTGFNEKVKGIFLVSLADKAQREIELVARRLEETRSLALAEKLTFDTREIIETQLEKHTEKVKSYIKESEIGNNISQAINLQSQLEVALSFNEKVLTKIETVSSEVSPVVTKVRKELSSISKEKNILQNDLSIKEDQNISVIASDRLRAAKTATEVAERLINQGVPQSEGINYQNQISSIKQELQKGQNLLEEGMYQEALYYFDQSFKNSSEIKFSIENFDQEKADKVFIQNKALQLGIPQKGDISDQETSIIVPVVKVEGDVKGKFIGLSPKSEVPEGENSTIVLPNVNNLR